MYYDTHSNYKCLKLKHYLKENMMKILKCALKTEGITMAADAESVEFDQAWGSEEVLEEI